MINEDFCKDLVQAFKQISIDKKFCEYDGEIDRDFFNEEVDFIFTFIEKYFCVEGLNYTEVIPSFYNSLEHVLETFKDDKNINLFKEVVKHVIYYENENRKIVYNIPDENDEEAYEQYELFEYELGNKLFKKLEVAKSERRGG